MKTFVFLKVWVSVCTKQEFEIVTLLRSSRKKVRFSIYGFSSVSFPKGPFHFRFNETMYFVLKWLIIRIFPRGGRTKAKMRNIIFEWMLYFFRVDIFFNEYFFLWNWKRLNCMENNGILRLLNGFFFFIYPF